MQGCNLPFRLIILVFDLVVFVRPPEVGASIHGISFFAAVFALRKQSQ